jgi:hypothetical protein
MAQRRQVRYAKLDSYRRDYASIAIYEYVS